MQEIGGDGFLIHDPLTRTLLGWDAAVWSYLLMISVHMALTEEHRVREYAIRDDENAGVVKDRRLDKAVAGLGEESTQ